jgi:hypothetical protein
MVMVSLLLLVLIGNRPVAQTAQTKPVDFNRDIRPILSDTCFTCHGPDEQNQQAGLRLDTKEGAFADRGGYQVIVPGKATESRLFQRVSAKEESLRMPPPTADRKLTQHQIELLRRWIDEGARWETHWAYSPPKRSALPSVKNAIDAFILSRLEREGLKPSPEADRTTLLRRLSFDLTGLPPTAAELDAFLSDTTPDAYEKQVDRLLRSPRYGERMAMQWLDLARYADTHGYHIDSHRDMWHWRDWVIDAFNRNLPFDQFTTEQLAGDLLPNATPEQKLATGFSRNHMINFEGGAIPEEYQTEYVVDRVETTSAVWMAMTMGCARCHDHKYDPIRQKDFYRFFAFFNTIPEKGLDGTMGNAQPTIQLPSAEQAVELKRLKQEIKLREDALAEAKVDPLLEKWQRETWHGSRNLVTLPPTDGLTAHYEFDGHLSDTSGHYRHGSIQRGAVTFGPNAIGLGGEFNGETHLSFAGAGDFDRDQPFSIAFWFNKGGSAGQELTLLQKLGQRQGGYELLFDGSVPVGDLKRGCHLYVRLSRLRDDPVPGIQVKTKTRIRMGVAQHLVLNYDGSSKAAGIRLFLDGQPFEVEVLQDHLTGSIRNFGQLEIGNKAFGNPYRGNLDDLRIYQHELTNAEIEQLSLHHPIRALLTADTRKFSENQNKARREKLRDYFLTYEAPELYRSKYTELTKLKKEKAALDKVVPTSMVMEEMEKARETHVLGRGDYRNLGEKVLPGVPSSLPPLPAGAPQNRLGLARWLCDPTHPLTARVAVNRYWQMYFGHGIVKTAEDFGSQGEAPVHAELLDWLATEFIQTGWDIKRMQRLIVTSAAYRQSSRVTPELVEKDPENRLLARGPRFRLPAEMVRDNALAASGLLNGEIGGSSVSPYQPKGLWEEMAFGDVFSAQTYVPSKGKDLYRRSMYTFWKRTVPPPSLATFDAPDREKCTARRALTNTPLQALVLMNDPTYVEAARALAQRTLTEAGGSPAKRIQFAFRQATGRKPSAEEVQLLSSLAQKQVALYRRDKQAASELVRVGESSFNTKLNPSELAAWTVVTSSILNLDETITKE